MTSGSVELDEVIELTIDRIAYGGNAVGRHHGLVIFVPLGAPGDRLLVRIAERKKNHARGEIVEVLTASPARRAAPCRYFGDCGGCQLQHISYDAQLEAKSGFIRDSLTRVGKIDWVKPIEIEHGPDLGYRSRARLQIDPRKHLVGFNRARTSAICDVEECLVFSRNLNSVLKQVRADVNSGAVSPQTFEIDIAVGGGEVSVHTTAESGGEEIEITIGRYAYRLAPSMFFQGNALLTAKLVEHVTSGERGGLALDLYCGVGLFTIPLAHHFARVIGVESDRASVLSARKNLRRNYASKARVIGARVEAALNDLHGSEIDLVVLDPPREGAPSAIQPLLTLRPARINYVSCDPVTLARDLRSLIDGGFELTQLKAFDLFPQTYHVEVVARLKWNGRMATR